MGAAKRTLNHSKFWTIFFFLISLKNGQTDKTKQKIVLTKLKKEANTIIFNLNSWEKSTPNFHVSQTNNLKHNCNANW